MVELAMRIPVLRSRTSAKARLGAVHNTAAPLALARRVRKLRKWRQAYSQGMGFKSPTRYNSQAVLRLRVCDSAERALYEHLLLYHSGNP